MYTEICIVNNMYLRFPQYGCDIGHGSCGHWMSRWILIVLFRYSLSRGTKVESERSTNKCVDIYAFTSFNPYSISISFANNRYYIRNNVPNPLNIMFVSLRCFEIHYERKHWKPFNASFRRWLHVNSEFEFEPSSMIRVMIRFRMVKKWFSQNTCFSWIFTGREFIMVNYIIKLAFEFQLDLQNPLKQPKMWIFEK